jgi:hypothetical protein
MPGIRLQFSGALNNCTCRGGLSGYIDFENSVYYRKYFNIAMWWKGAAAVGALPLFGSFLAAILLLIRLKSLWHTSEQSNSLGRDAEVEMQWLI